MNCGLSLHCVPEVVMVLLGRIIIRLIISVMRAKPSPQGYIVYPGNNSTAIEQALKKRNIWTALTPAKDLLSASFLWKQSNYSPKVCADFEEVVRFYPNRSVLLNHFENNAVITSKSGLLRTLRYYCTHETAMIDKNRHIFDIIPTSFIVYANKGCTDFKDFIERFEQLEKKNYQKEKIPEKHCLYNLWFVKPESENQGKGIILSNNLKEIETFLGNKPVNSGWVIQKAIEKPLLYDHRKFDIRVWVLVTSNFEIYYYNAPYLRTSSVAYDPEKVDTEIQLTNNSQQKKLKDYSKFEEGNTLPFEVLKKSIANRQGSEDKAAEIMGDLSSKFKELIIDTMMCARKHLFKSNIRKREFELFGFDFLVDEDYRPWMIEVNNNPYLGTPNAFMKEMMPNMIDEMMEIILDPLFPPTEYTPVEEKKFELVHKEINLFRITPIRVARSFSNTKRKNSLTPREGSGGPSERLPVTEDLFKIDPTKPKESRLKYSTPTQTLKSLIENYNFTDLDPFMIPVTLILNSSRLKEEENMATNIKNLKLITQTRVASILLDHKIFSICKGIFIAQHYHQVVKAAIIAGYENASKSFKDKLFVLKKVVPEISQLIRIYSKDLMDELVAAIVSLLVKLGGMIDRNVFIPGESREGEFIRELFIKSNCLSLLLYLSKTYPKVCEKGLEAFLENLWQKDWELFYECSGNKEKRAYSPKMNTSTAEENFPIGINVNIQALYEDKPRVLSVRQNHDIKKFQERYTGFPAIKKEKLK